MANYLIKYYDDTEELIRTNSTNENDFINTFNDKIISTTNSYRTKPMVRAATNNENELPFDININNNFQRYYYNDYNDDNDDTGFFIPHNIKYSPTVELVQSTVTPIVQSTVTPIVQSTVAPIVQSTVSPIVQSTVAPVSKPSEKFEDYFKDLRYGFKDYFGFNN